MVTKTKKRSDQIRQGDVLLVRVDSLPAGLKPIARENGRVVIAHGEVTGHAHAITDRLTRMFGDEAGTQYIEAPKDTQLVHEEHGTVDLEAGVWMRRPQREYSPEGLRSVLD